STFNYWSVRNRRTLAKLLTWRCEMAAIALTEPSLAALKKALRKDLPDVRSSHITEALAVALRRRTHACLRVELARLQCDPPIELLDDGLFDRRLQDFGYPPDPEFSFEMLEDAGIIPTQDPRCWDIEYKSDREKAWRNLMVCTINQALERKLFSLRPNDNRWPNADKEGHLFDFTLPNGLPARGYVQDIGYAELSIHVAVNPKGDMVQAFNAGFEAGDVFARGWLERDRGAWLQSETTAFNCRKALLNKLASMAVNPHGYGDRGQVIM
ncbi:hypothetical protein, partial [Thiolapillus sp.]|uniref:hypothetical protein n=2 Tax=Thiolapillus sp. TaxID=2017437 RepID=UPI0025F26900